MASSPSISTTRHISATYWSAVTLAPSCANSKGAMPARSSSSSQSCPRLLTPAAIPRTNAMEIVKGELRSRPGATRVVVHIPQAGGAKLLPMEQRSGVAWDAGLPAILRDRVGGDGIELELISPAT